MKSIAEKSKIANFSLAKGDLHYPPLLHEISDPPEKLFWRGQNLNPADNYFAVVGTRRPSPYGKQTASEFSAALAKSGFVIVSGLAYGIDAIAHEACLNAGGRTIAVLGSGLPHISPPSNIPLAQRIEKSGTIITEYEAEVHATKITFPKRNRIIAGMAIATLLIEAPEKSGGLITARLALEYNRDVFALPGNITQETSIGCNRLIRDAKAFPVTCVKDIFEYMEISNPGAIQQSIFLDEDEDTIYKLLKKSSLTVDALISQTQLPASKISQLLSLLELKGLIRRAGSYAFVTR